MQTAGRKFGRAIEQARAAVAATPAARLAELVGKGEPFRLGELEFAPEDVTVTYRAAEGWARCGRPPHRRAVLIP